MRCADVKVPDCSWGIGAKVANDSMRSAASTLAEYASKGGQADIDGYAHHGSCCLFAVQHSAATHVLLCQPGSASYVTLAAGLGILHQTLPMVIC